MDLLQIKGTVDKNGNFVVPALLLKGMGIIPGNPVKLTYLPADPLNSSTPYREFTISPGEDEEEFEFTVPHSLLNAAEIPDDSDLEVTCTKGAIIVTAGDILDSLPEDLCGLFRDLGIDPDTVRDVMRSGDFKKTNPERR